MAGELEPKEQSWIENTRSYLGDIRSEMKRVTWPNREAGAIDTVVVIVSVFIFAAYFKVVDTIIENTVVTGVIRRAHEVKCRTSITTRRCPKTNRQQPETSKPPKRRADELRLRKTLPAKSTVQPKTRPTEACRRRNQALVHHPHLFRL